MKSPASIHPSHILSPDIHTHLPEDSRAPCVVCKKQSREEEESCLHVWAQQAWHNGTDSFGDSIGNTSHSWAISTEPKDRRKYRRGEAHDSYRQED